MSDNTVSDLMNVADRLAYRVAGVAEGIVEARRHGRGVSAAMLDMLAKRVDQFIAARDAVDEAMRNAR